MRRKCISLPLMFVHVLGVFLGLPTLAIAIKRDKVARISPFATSTLTSSASSSSSKGKASGKGKGKKGSLNIQELHVFGLSQVSMLNISFFDNDSSNMIFSWTTTLDGDDTSWYGEAVNGIGSITMIRPQNSSRFAGSASFNNTMYTIIALPDGSIQVSALNATDLPPESSDFDDVFNISSTPKTTRRELPMIDNTPRDLAKTDDGSIIDILCIYTRQALCNEAIGADFCNITLYRKVMDDKCAVAIAETNIAYNLSGVQTTLRLVYSDVLDPTYNESSSSFSRNINYLMYGSDAIAQRVHDLRDKYRADLVGLILNSGAVCGASPMYYNDEYYGFFSVSRQCMTGYYSFGHEIGHNLGCYHETQQYPSPKPSNSSYGYQDTNNAFRTIMSYSCSNGANCPRIQRFSNPNRTFYSNKKNVPIGSSTANNVNQINSVLYNVANYRLSLENSATSAPTSNPSVLLSKMPTVKPLPKPSKRPTAKSRPSPSRRPSRKPTLRPVRRKPSSKPSVLRKQK